MIKGASLALRRFAGALRFARKAIVRDFHGPFKPQLSLPFLSQYSLLALKVIRLDHP